MFRSKSCYMSILLLATFSILAQSVALDHSAMATDAYASGTGDEKNEDGSMQFHKRPSFFVGSRYGRSNGGSADFSSQLFAPSKARRLNMVPRNDRFFLGSRYGKRAGEYVSPYEQDSGYNKSNGFEERNTNATPSMMSCVYTGLRNLYRCNSVEEINNIINQLTTAQHDNDKRK